MSAADVTPEEFDAYMAEAESARLVHGPVEEMAGIRVDSPRSINLQGNRIVPASPTA